MRSKNLGLQIRLLRVKANMTQGELAKVLGTSQVILSGWERNVHHPTEKYLKKLTKVLNLIPLLLRCYKVIKTNGEHPSRGGKGRRLVHRPSSPES